MLLIYSALKEGDFVGVEINGFDELKNHLSKIENNVSNLSKTDNLSFDELFTSDFMSKHTNCKSFDEFLSASGFTQSFEDIPDDDWDSYVSQHSSFTSWEEMMDTAVEQYVSIKLGFESTLYDLVCFYFFY